MRVVLGRYGKRIVAGVGALLLLGFGVGALSDRAVNNRAAQVGPESGGTRPASTNGTNAYDAASSSGVTGKGSFAAPQVDVPGVTLPQQIIKSSELSIQIKRGTFGSSWDNVFSLATRLGGYVASSSRGDGGGRPIPIDLAASGAARDAGPAFGDITLRVPSAKFEAALRELRALGAVKSDSVSTDDVTQQAVDIDARLRNARAQEALLLKFLGESKNVGDSLKVQAALSSTQEQIEQLTGAQRHLKSQTSLATISLHLTEPGAAAAARDDEAGPSFSRAWRTATVGLVRIATVAMIGVVWLVPLAILGILALVFVRRLRSQPQI